MDAGVGERAARSEMDGPGEDGATEMLDRLEVDATRAGGRENEDELDAWPEYGADMARSKAGYACKRAGMCIVDCSKPSRQRKGRDPDIDPGVDIARAWQTICGFTQTLS